MAATMYPYWYRGALEHLGLRADLPAIALDNRYRRWWSKARRVILLHIGLRTLPSETQLPVPDGPDEDSRSLPCVA